MFGMLSNDPKRLGCFLYAHRTELAPPPGLRPDGVGIGWYSNNEALLSKRPAPEGGELSCHRFAKGIYSDALMMHARAAGGAPWKVENTHPFRFMNWLFAHTGSITGFERISTKLFFALPGHLQRNVKGETDSEVAFHVFLNILGRVKPVDSSDIRPRDVADALAKTVEVIEDASGAERQGTGGQSVMNFICSNGSILAGARFGAPMLLIRFQGIPDCAVCKLDSKSLNADALAQAHRRFTGVVLASEPHQKVPGAIELPDRTVVTVGPDLGHTIKSF
ncbi:MAG: class II glutamine amidotransferase [Deltaproteobacteria bacterium]|nr:class II glutamine amidotransferase [Deltaproteobacteria bacterium]